MITESQASKLKHLADQWASHAAWASKVEGVKRRMRNQRRDEMKSRFLKELQSITENANADR